MIDFLSDLAERRGVASSTQMQALSALLFLYREVLQRPVGICAQWCGREVPAGYRLYVRARRWRTCLRC